MERKSRKKWAVFTKSLIDDYLDKGFPISNYVEDFPTLCLVVGSGNIEWCKKLMDAGLSHKVSHPKTGKNAFWTAVCFLDVKMVELLLERGADPNHKDFEGKTVFQYLLQVFDKVEIKAQQEILKLLIKYGFDVKNEYIGIHRITYLEMAIFNRREDLCEILLKNGVSIYNCIYISEAMNMPRVTSLIRQEMRKRTALQCFLEIPLYRQVELLTAR